MPPMMRGFGLGIGYRVVANRTSSKIYTMKTPLSPSQTAIVGEICKRVSLGASLRQAVADLRGELGEICPSMPTFLRWMSDQPALADQYAQARREGTERLFDELEQMAEDSKEAVTKEEAAGWRNVIDVRKWRLSKMAPERYGDRVAVTGADGGPVQHAVGAVVQVAGLDPIAASKAYQDFMNAGKSS